MTEIAPQGRPSPPAIPPERYGRRLAHAQDLAAERGVAALLIGVGADLRYFTGYVAKPLERLTMLVLPAAGQPSLFAPRLEAIPARSCLAATSGFVDVVTWHETEDPLARVAERLASTLGRPVGSISRVAVSDRLWASFVLGLQGVLPAARFELATPVTRELRMVKEAEEVELLRLAAQAADRVVEQIAAGRLIGRTERDVSREVSARLIDEGHEAAEFGIVASGPNSASPHHEAGPRQIRAGDAIVLDIGGHLGGYGSDITRMLWVTGGDRDSGPDPGFLELFELVRQAQRAATAAVRPGTPAAEIDAAARGVIQNGGYGEHFNHRVGHGIGLEGHEDPYLVGTNDEPLQEGNTFSIEPGIYLEGRYGARLEDIVVCSPDGPIVLNEASHELFVVPG